MGAALHFTFKERLKQLLFENLWIDSADFTTIAADNGNNDHSPAIFPRSTIIDAFGRTKTVSCPAAVNVLFEAGPSGSA